MSIANYITGIIMEYVGIVIINSNDNILQLSIDLLFLYVFSLVCNQFFDHYANHWRQWYYRSLL